MSLETRLVALTQAIGLDIKAIYTALAGKQAALTSGTNIKTVNGQSLLGSGDLSVAGGGGLSEMVTVNFGNLAAKERVFTMTVAGAVMGQRVMATPSLLMPAGVALDELELDPITVAAAVVAANTVKLVVASTRGRIRGQRNINLILG
jgi:hypothetical protein